MNSSKSNIQSNVPTITEWFSGRSILVTGATGFIGKVLLEKLLRSIPDIHKIYIIVRPKYGVASSSRTEEITKLPIFQHLKNNNPAALKKIVAIEGDVSIDNLGINEDNKILLQSNVSVVFHVAATVKFQEPLKSAVILNLCGTNNLLKLCAGMKKLEVVVYVSTTYCHCEVPILEEKVHPSHWNPKDIMNLITWMDDKNLELVTPGIIKPEPNTYSFTKGLAETLVTEYGKELPVTIVRPPIVLPAMKEPLPGWVDSASGAVGFQVAIGRGMWKCLLVDAEQKTIVMPVDIVCNATIIAAWYRGTRSVSEIPVYNLCQSEENLMTWGEFFKLSLEEIRNNPFNFILWYPDVDIRASIIVYKIISFLFQLIPMYVMDFILMLAGTKLNLVRHQKRIYKAMDVLKVYTLRGWNNQTTNFTNMPAVLSEQDRATFYTDAPKVDQAYMENMILGIRKYYLKEDPETLPQARKYLKLLYIVNWAFKGLIFSGLIWMMFKILS